MLWNLAFRFVSVCFTDARHYMGLGMLFQVMAGRWVVAWVIYFSTEIIFDA